jgi:hypothetical protein
LGRRAASRTPHHTLQLAPGAALGVTSRGADVRFAAGALELAGAFPASGESDGLELVVEHSLSDLQHVWVPHLTPEDGYVIGDFVFRSPAVILATREIALALLPDLDDVARADGWRAWLDYDHPRGRVVLAAGAYDAQGHVFYTRQKLGCRSQAVKLRLHVVSSSRPADLQNPYRMAARWLWRRWGRAAHLRGGTQRAPLSRYARWVVRWAFSPEGWGETVWQSFQLGGEQLGAPVFIVDVTRHPSVPPAERRWREPRSIWNQAWFSTQRCANGLLRHARQNACADLEERATRMTAVALAAPQDDGLFPAVLTSPEEIGGPSWAGARWTGSDRRPAAASERACHLVDAAFTCRMLLEWHALTGEPRALDRARRFADRLMRLQRPSGAFPGWVEPDGRVVDELAESAETAVGVALLFELAAAGDADPRWKDAALAGLRFLEGVVAAGRWEDFETYYSCAPWGAPELIGKKVPRNGVFKQNTLSIAWCAEAMLRAWSSLGERRLLATARRCIDELSLYQAVWDPPFLPAPAHGGFGVMNADCEWNDARQSLFAPLYLEMYRHTGDLELFERGVSALRTSFSMLYCPENEALARAYQRRFPFFGAESYGFMMENQGHSGPDPIGTFTIFTWGNGSALAAAATVRDRFGDLYVDSARGRALPIDGLVSEVRGRRVLLEDGYRRGEVTAVYADGQRRAVAMKDGRGVLPLFPGAGRR